MNVREIIEETIRKTGVSRLSADQTCDHLMAGSPETQVRKIATTFMATVDVIRKAAEAGVNLIITHEPTWFTGADSTEWLQSDPVYIQKKNLIDENGIAIWRFHDHMHMASEDGIYRGFDLEFGWGKYLINNSEKWDKFGAAYQIPATSLRDLAVEFKRKLNMDVIQIVGEFDMAVERVGVLVGGGSLGLGIEEMPMQFMRENELDVVVCGEITEWTTVAYVKDAAALGLDKGLLIIGHERSEEAGMKHLDKWLKSVVGDIEIIFIDAEEPFSYL